jgi:hypothetical protein
VLDTGREVALRVDAVPIDVTPPTVPAEATIVASGQSAPGAIVLHEESIYWMSFGIFYGVPGTRIASWFNGELVKCPKAGCPEGPTLLVSSLSLPLHTESIPLATNGNDVLWSDHRDPPNGLFRCSVAGCDAPAAMGHSASAFALADGIVYVPRGNCIESCPVSGCASPAKLLCPPELDGGYSYPVGMVADT